MKQGILNLYKRCGETPLECLNRFKAAHPSYEHVPMSYAGRLDPLAEGVLIVLAGEDRFKRDEFNALEKVYEFEVLWGFASDTHDALGIVRFVSESSVIASRLEAALQNFRGKIELAYPKFSSKTIDGVPLFRLARDGKLENVKMPTKHVEISYLGQLGTEMFCGTELLKLAEEKIASVKGDFRQEEARASWKRAIEDRAEEFFPITGFRSKVSSGTYIRSLAEQLGRELECGGLTWSIKRTAVGNFGIEDSLP
jgi:tRNA pseudouridine(55) synthase